MLTFSSHVCKLTKRYKLILQPNIKTITGATWRRNIWRYGSRSRISILLYCLVMWILPHNFIFSYRAQSAKVGQASTQCQRTRPMYRVKPYRHARHQFTEIIDVRRVDRQRCSFGVFIVVRNPIHQRRRCTDAATEIDYGRLPCLWR